MKKIGLVIFIVAFISAIPYGKSQNLCSEKMSAALNNAQQGDVVSLPWFFSEKMENLTYDKVPLQSPQLVFSDDPEYVVDTEAVVLKEAIMPGSVRVYLYNVNGVVQPQKMPRKIVAMLKNTGNKIMHFRMLKHSTQMPSVNYYFVGKQGLADYFASKADSNIVNLKPGEAVPLDPRSDSLVANYNDLVHGIYEFTIDQPGEVVILQTSPQVNSVDALNRIHYIVPLGHLNAGRGLFSTCNLKITTKKILDTQNGSVVLTVADGVTDGWVTGVEGTTKTPVKLEGNYGVMYDIELKWKSTDGKGLALVTWAPQAGHAQWCDGMANTVVVSEGKYKGGIVQLPTKTLTVGGIPNAILIQIFKPLEKGKVQTIKLIYSPPGASCLPTPLGFIPIDVK
jgi:hypothetical protein